MDGGRGGTGATRGLRVAHDDGRFGMRRGGAGGTGRAGRTDDPTTPPTTPTAPPSEPTSAPTEPTTPPTPTTATTAAVPDVTTTTTAVPSVTTTTTADPNATTTTVDPNTTTTTLDPNTTTTTLDPNTTTTTLDPNTMTTTSTRSRPPRRRLERDTTTVPPVLPPEDMDSDPMEPPVEVPSGRIVVPRGAFESGQLRAITFPVAGPITYVNDWGACRDGCARAHKGNDLIGDRRQPILAMHDGVIDHLVDHPTAGYGVAIRRRRGVGVPRVPPQQRHPGDG